MKKLLVLVAFSVLLLVPVSAFGGSSIIVSDDTFNDSDWTLTTIADTNPGATTVSASQSLAGGNPGAYRDGQHDWGPGFITVANLKDNFAHDPSTQGAIESLDCSLDFNVFNVSLSGGGVGIFITLFQDETYYRSVQAFTIFEFSGWVPLSFNDNSFLKVLGPGPSIPDLSSTGGIIQLGYATANTTGSHRISDFGVDNFLCTLNLLKSEPVGDDHYLGYEAKETKDSPDFIQRLVNLVDQFGTGTFNVEKTKMLFNPVVKQFGGEVILSSDTATHLKAYKIKEGENNILIKNQFGELIVNTTKAELLLVPTAKSLDDPDVSELDSTDVDHYKCYKVEIDKNAPLQFVPLQVTLFDPNFNAEKLFDVIKPKMLCNPVDKDGEGIKNPENHLMCYAVEPAEGFVKNKKVSVFTNNQFGSEQLDVTKEKELCVPSEKSILP